MAVVPLYSQTFGQSASSSVRTTFGLLRNGFGARRTNYEHTAIINPLNTLLTMAHLNTNWLLNGMSGKACNHDNVYTKQNKKTGAVYAVKLCNPYTGEPSEAQAAQRTKFKATQDAVNAFITAGRAAVAEDRSGQTAVNYLKALAAFNAQNKYATLRGFVQSKYTSYDASTRVATVSVGSSSVSGGGTSGSSTSGTGGNSGGNTGGTGNDE